MDHYLTQHTKLAQYESRLYTRSETIKHLEENGSSKLLDISLGNNFFVSDLKTIVTKAKMNKWDSMN